MVELLIIAGITIPAWLVFLFLSMEVFYRKGQSEWLGFACALFLGPIALIVGLVMPKDREALEERRIQDDLRRQRNEQLKRESIARWIEAGKAADQAKRELVQTVAPSASGEKLTTAGAILLIACPLLFVIVQNSTAQLVLAALALIGLGVYVAGAFGSVSTETV